MKLYKRFFWFWDSSSYPRLSTYTISSSAVRRGSSFQGWPFPKPPLFAESTSNLISRHGEEVKLQFGRYGTSLDSSMQTSAAIASSGKSCPNQHWHTSIGWHRTLARGRPRLAPPRHPQLSAFPTGVGPILRPPITTSIRRLTSSRACRDASTQENPG